MPEKPKTATASDPTVASTLAKQTIELQEAKTTIDALTDEVKKLKRQLTESNAVIDSEIRAGFYQILRARTTYTEAELDAMTTEELQKLCQTFTRTKKDADMPFLSIRTGGDADPNEGRLTVGPLFGKKREEILKMEGEF